MKRLLKTSKKHAARKIPEASNRKQLERKALEGAEKAVREYRRVFERLAEYDRG